VPVQVPPLPLRPVGAMVAALGLLGLVGWFVLELRAGERVGLAERVAAGAQAFWPLVAATSGPRVRLRRGAG
jgi:hypothetical protein